MSCMHRDLKPANLMLGGIPHDSVDRDIAAELGVVKIADFGLSKSLAQNVSAARSRSGMDLDRDLEDGMEGHQLERSVFLLVWNKEFPKDRTPAIEGCHGRY